MDHVSYEIRAKINIHSLVFKKARVFRPTPENRFLFSDWSAEKSRPIRAFHDVI